LRSFYRLVQPGGPGWKRVIDKAKKEGEFLEAAKQSWDVPTGILCMVLGCFAVYSALFATGYWIYGRHTLANILTVIAVVSTYVLTKAWKRLRLAS
jgi:integral membrane sensor domain MASE1